MNYPCNWAAQATWWAHKQRGVAYSTRRPACMQCKDLRCAQPLNCLVWSSMLRWRVHRTMWELTTYLQGGHKHIKEFPRSFCIGNFLCHACTMWLLGEHQSLNSYMTNNACRLTRNFKQCRCLTVKKTLCWTTASTWCSLPHWCVIYHTHT